MTQLQETEMNNSNDNTPRPEMQDDIIELGAASIETKGPLIPPVEGMGAQPTGISAE